MRLSVAQLLKENIGSQVDVGLDLSDHRLADDIEVSFLKGTLNLWRTTEGIWARGSLIVGVDLQCVRCLAPVTEAFEVELDERFQLPPIEASEVDQVSLIDDDYSIDLGPVLCELVVLGTPMRVVCRADCAGLCVTCGKDLNQGLCDCQPDDIDPRMAALKALLT
jgi:DUF177 domain-containing protein